MIFQQENVCQFFFVQNMEHFIAHRVVQVNLINFVKTNAESRLASAAARNIEEEKRTKNEY